MIRTLRLSLSVLACSVALAVGAQAETIKVGLLKIDVKDIEHQIAWFHAQAMVKGDFDANAVIDRRYAIALRR